MGSYVRFSNNKPNITEVMPTDCDELFFWCLFVNKFRLDLYLAILFCFCNYTHARDLTMISLSYKVWYQGYAASKYKLESVSSSVLLRSLCEIGIIASLKFWYNLSVKSCRHGVFWMGRF